MVVVEKSIFTRQVLSTLSDEDYRKLQVLLAHHPRAGDLLLSGGGLRKIGWATEGKVKRSGVRVIYYWAVARDQILMLCLFPKSERADLTPAQIKSLSKIIEGEYP
jgi:hypothetical protein